MSGKKTPRLANMLATRKQQKRMVKQVLAAVERAALVNLSTLPDPSDWRWLEIRALLLFHLCREANVSFQKVQVNFNANGGLYEEALKRVQKWEKTTSVTTHVPKPPRKPRKPVDPLVKMARDEIKLSREGEVNGNS